MSDGKIPEVIPYKSDSIALLAKRIANDRCVVFDDDAAGRDATRDVMVQLRNLHSASNVCQLHGKGVIKVAHLTRIHDKGEKASDIIYEHEATQTKKATGPFGEFQAMLDEFLESFTDPKDAYMQDFVTPAGYSIEGDKIKGWTVITKDGARAKIIVMPEVDNVEPGTKRRRKE